MASPGHPGAVLVPRCPVIFNGTNWGDFVFHMEVHMDGQLLWGYLTDADDDAKNALLEAFEAEMESYQSDLGVYETWLREKKSAKAILLASMEPSVLAATPPQVSLPPSQPSPVVMGAPSGIQCGYYKIYGHEEKDCRKKQRDRSGRRGRRSFQGSGGSSTSQSTRSVSAAEQEVLALFHRLTTTAQASGHGTTAQASSSTPPPSGISSPWFLDSGASFHMTPHATHLSSLSSPDPPISVRTADGTGEVFFRPLRLIFLLFRMFPNSLCNSCLRVKSLIMVVA
ncbi:unnamed protein product [Miscanthus lutarioriparius]|uniref:Uncharacterized protein n=1 Tax=Miscanthus lutarioriparius TaxID=422564 RepID=A0A811M706_9POAL|nr:unnamed protein product [Miscanthus lutarioriparius]